MGRNISLVNKVSSHAKGGRRVHPQAMHGEGGEGYYLMSAPHIFQETVGLIFFHAPGFEYHDLAFEETSEEKYGNKYCSVLLLLLFLLVYFCLSHSSVKFETDVCNE